jgi:hypothetical protein
LIPATDCAHRNARNSRLGSARRNPP